MKNMTVKIIPEGVIYENQKEKRLTIMLLVPFYSFYEKYETRRAGCPLGLEFLAAELVAKGFNLIFIDACLSNYNQLTPQNDGTIRYGLTDIQLKEVLKQFKPDLVGITNLFSNQAGNVLATARLVRESYPDALIVEGGGHATGAAEEVLSDGPVDIVVRGEGMITFTKLCEALENDVSYESVAGIDYRNKTGAIRHNPNPDFLENLDELAPRLLEIPLHPIYDTPEHTGGSRKTRQGRHIYMMTSFGCAFHCSFCLSDLMTGPRTRFFSLEYIRRELIRFKQAGVTEVIIEDDQFLADIRRALAIADLFKKLRLYWFEEGGISLFKLMKTGTNLNYRDMINRLAESYCYRFYLAIESANPQSLSRSQKPAINADTDYAAEIVAYIKEKGIEAVGGFMIGFKTDGYEESLEDIERTITYAKRLKKAGLAYVMLFIYTALPGTAVFSSLKRFLSGYSSHERAAFPVAGLTAEELTEKRLIWLGEINGESQELAKEKRNWGL
ncbi:MAG: radical SAM protein [Patescibacteria group bacterium]